MTEQVHVLCVDDEPRVLEGLALTLRRHFRVSTATNGQTGLTLVEGANPPAVVVSDMRMPEMDGAVFLSRVRECAPDTVRILLTGHSDIEMAAAAVNHGQVFRFLTKPCPASAFLSAVQAAVEQHRLITAERVLLEQTLRGSVKALIEILSLSNPLGFGRALRLKQHAAELLVAAAIPMSWQIEVAIMLSQIGCVTLPPETTRKVYYGEALSSEEADMVQRLPALAVQAIETIPRLEAVRAILQHQERNYDGSGSPPGAPCKDALPLGARVLKLVADYDVLEAGGSSPEMATGMLGARSGRYDPQLLEAFMRCKARGATRSLREMSLSALVAGLHLAQDLVSTNGLLLVARGQEVTPGLLQRLRNLPAGTVREPIRVFSPSDSTRK